jgi:sporulation protein YabP
MDNQLINVNTNLKHDITLTGRRELLVTGVRNIESFDSEEFLVETNLGFLHIKGNGLTLEKMDNENNELIIKGQMNSLTYVNNQGKKENKGSFFKKVFK